MRAVRSVGSASSVAPRVLLLALVSACGGRSTETSPVPETPPASQAGEADASAAPAATLSQEERIERLIAAVAGLQDAVFLRNGAEHDAAAAAEHLRGKWHWKAGEIATAEDFIRVAGTRSSLSGEVYRIRFADGQVVELAVYLRGELAAIDAGAAPAGR
jgi:hypothetical protein